MLATQIVHTSGINWESYAAIVGTVLAALTLVLAWTSKRQSDLQKDINGAVNNLREVLVEKLESKEAVSQIRVDLERTNTKVDLLYQLGVHPSGQTRE